MPAAPPLAAAARAAAAPGRLGCHTASAAAAVERLVLRLVCDLAAAAAVAEAAPGAGGVTVCVELADPTQARIVESGGFAARVDRKLTLEVSPQSSRRLARLLAALDAVHRLSLAGRAATQRELFYRATADGDGTLFPGQKVMNDRASHRIRDAVGALGIGRPHLGVLTAERGLVSGRARWPSGARGAPRSAARPPRRAARRAAPAACRSARRCSTRSSTWRSGRRAACWSWRRTPSSSTCCGAACCPSCPWCS
ncbi:unnamed protein product [Prorocentrum cordatum]|uniref:Spo11/DNA topoisomerase VI subunit A N-terminal domain-containing protein n=1 Tax=Prorocentrum cordatum TaxID=2364126 RepID=A0ABN9V1A6_9DINO|nr:unnamed protein product [Polarella glacialis]